jgi:hypothetical protein
MYKTHFCIKSYQVGKAWSVCECTYKSPAWKWRINDQYWQILVLRVITVLIHTFLTWHHQRDCHIWKLNTSRFIESFEGFNSDQRQVNFVFSSTFTPAVGSILDYAYRGFPSSGMNSWSKTLTLVTGLRMSGATPPIHHTPTLCIRSLPTHLLTDQE